MSERVERERVELGVSRPPGGNHEDGVGQLMVRAARRSRSVEDLFRSYSAEVLRTVADAIEGGNVAAIGPELELLSARYLDEVAVARPPEEI